MTGSTQTLEPPYRSAIIGTGRIGDTYDEEILHYPDLELPDEVIHAGMYTAKPKSLGAGFQAVDAFDLVAGANRGRERLEAFGERRNVSNLYTDYEEMLAEEQLNVVGICTPSPGKCDAVVACAEAGVDAVIVEKAFATSMEEADRMLEACESAGTFIAVDHPMRFSAMYRELKRLIDEGEIGDLGHLTTHTGSLVHGATHDFDIIRYLGGDVTSVYARIPDLEVEHDADNPLNATYDDLRGDVLLTLEDGQIAHVESTSGSQMGVVLRGTEGYITSPRGGGGVINLVQGRSRPAAEFGYEDDPEHRPIHDVNWEKRVTDWTSDNDAYNRSATERLLHELDQTLSEGGSFVSTGEDGAAALEVGIAAYESAIRGEPVELPLDERRLRVNNK